MISYELWAWHVCWHRYVYWQQLDVRLECALLTASFLKAALTFSSHLPTSDLAYATFEPNPFKSVGGVKPFPGVDLFGDVFRCSPSSLVASLRWCCQELVHRGHALKVRNTVAVVAVVVVVVVVVLYCCCCYCHYCSCSMNLTTCRVW